MIKDTYHVITEGYKNKGWVQNNGWEENSDGILLMNDWDDAFKERFHTIFLELGGTITDGHYNDIYEFQKSNNDDIWNNNVNENNNEQKNNNNDDSKENKNRNDNENDNDGRNGEESEAKVTQ